MSDDACKQNCSLLLFLFVVVVVSRARLDPKVKRESLGLPERKETRDGLVDLDYRDPGVHR